MDITHVLERKGQEIFLEGATHIHALMHHSIYGPAFHHAREEASHLLDRLAPDLVFHGKAHTIDYVLPAALLLAEREGVVEKERFLLAIAALFHDTGFADTYLNNEPIGAEYAKQRMIRWNTSGNSVVVFDAEDISIVVDAIRNTDMKAPPKNIHEHILRDADLSSMGRGNFLAVAQALQQENLSYPQATLHNQAQNDQMRKQVEYDFLSQHTRFTQSAHMLYDEQKQKNILLFV